MGCIYIFTIPHAKLKLNLLTSPRVVFRITSENHANPVCGLQTIAGSDPNQDLGFYRSVAAERSVACIATRIANTNLIRPYLDNIIKYKINNMTSYFNTKTPNIFQIIYSDKFKMYDFTVLNNNKVIYHYHFKNLKDINKLIQQYK